jgi:thiol:disulfide interchange protein DsbC
MFKSYLAVFFVLFLSSSISVYANDAVSVPASIAKNPQVEKFDANFLKTKLKLSLGIEVEQVLETPLPGIAMVVTSKGLYYASYNGDYFIQGKVYSLGDSVVDLADERLAKLRIEGMEKFSGDMIVYPAKNEKHVITVFTDITCGYCRKMHEQMTAYNDNGITVRYLAYPRSGVFDQNGGLTKGFQDLRSIWCNEDPNTALTKAKSGSGVAQRICDKPVEEEFDFGRQVGVNGTPAIMLANGMMIPGYQAPEQLVRILQEL